MRRAVLLFERQGMARAWRAWREHAEFLIWRRDKLQQVQLVTDSLHFNDMPESGVLGYQHAALCCAMAPAPLVCCH